MARDAAWFCEPRAQKVLAQINAFFSIQGPLSIGDGYTLRGKKFSTVHNAAFVGPVATSALFSSDDNFRQVLWKDLVHIWGGGYYANHLRHLSLLFVSGLMPNPLEIDKSKTSNQQPATSNQQPATSNQQPARGR